MPTTAFQKIITTNYDLFFRFDRRLSRHKSRSLRRNICPLLVTFPHDEVIVEIGPGCGELLRILRDEMEFTRIEAFEVCDAYAAALRSEEFDIKSSLSTEDYICSFDDASLGVVIMIDVLEHIPRAESMLLMNAIRRALKPGGIVIIQVPNLSALFAANMYFADYTHCNPFNELSIEKFLQAAGFGRCEVRATKLSLSPRDVFRSALRAIIFLLARILTAVVGITRVKILTQNIIAVGHKSR